MNGDNLKNELKKVTFDSDKCLRKSKAEKGERELEV